MRTSSWFDEHDPLSHYYRGHWSVPIPTFLTHAFIGEVAKLLSPFAIIINCIIDMNCSRMMHLVRFPTLTFARWWQGHPYELSLVFRIEDTGVYWIVAPVIFSVSSTFRHPIGERQSQSRNGHIRCIIHLCQREHRTCKR